MDKLDQHQERQPDNTGARAQRISGRQNRVWLGHRHASLTCIAQDAAMSGVRGRNPNPKGNAQMIALKELRQMTPEQLKAQIIVAAKARRVVDLGQFVDELIWRINKKTTTTDNKTPISLDDAKAYGIQIGLSIDDVEAFYDHHEARTWISGRTRIVDGKAALRTWKRMKAQFAKRPRFGKQQAEPPKSKLDQDIEAYIAERKRRKQQEGRLC